MNNEGLLSKEEYILLEKIFKCYKSAIASSQLGYPWARNF